MNVPAVRMPFMALQAAEASYKPLNASAGATVKQTTVWASSATYISRLV